MFLQDQDEEVENLDNPQQPQCQQESQNSNNNKRIPRRAQKRQINNQIFDEIDSQSQRQQYEPGNVLRKISQNEDLPVLLAVDNKFQIKKDDSDGDDDNKQKGKNIKLQQQQIQINKMESSESSSVSPKRDSKRKSRQNKKQNNNQQQQSQQQSSISPRNTQKNDQVFCDSNKDIQQINLQEGCQQGNQKKQGKITSLVQFQQSSSSEDEKEQSQKKSQKNEKSPKKQHKIQKTEENIIISTSNIKQEDLEQQKQQKGKINLILSQNQLGEEEEKEDNGKVNYNKDSEIQMNSISEKPAVDAKNQIETQTVVQEVEIKEVFSMPFEKCQIKQFISAPIQPGYLLQCEIRKKSGFFKTPTYTLYLGEKNNEKYPLLIAKKRIDTKSTYYEIYVPAAEFKQNLSGIQQNQKISQKKQKQLEKEENYVGKLKANFFGTEYQLFDGGVKPGQKQIQQQQDLDQSQIRANLAVIIYDVIDNLRRINVLLPEMDPQNPQQQQFYRPMSKQNSIIKKYKQFHKKMQEIPEQIEKNSSKIKQNSFQDNCALHLKNFEETQILMQGLQEFKNKQPIYNSAKKCFEADFSERAVQASIKNFMLISKNISEHTFLKNRNGKICNVFEINQNKQHNQNDENQNKDQKEQSDSNNKSQQNQIDIQKQQLKKNDSGNEKKDNGDQNENEDYDCEDDVDQTFLQLGKVNSEIFNMDFQWPLSPLQAFGICLSSFDKKWE